MSYRLNNSVERVPVPPIAEAAGWLERSVSNFAPINLSQAVPSYQSAPELCEYTARCITDGSTTLYTEILGIDDLREALADHMSVTYQGRVGAASVGITAGCNQAFCAAILAIAEPGDNIVLTTPWYFNHAMWLEMQGIEIRHIAATSAGTALPSPDELASVCDARTRALALISPNNPTGAIYPADLLDSFFDKCASLGIALILDETYKDFLEPGDAPHRLFQRPDWQNTFVQLYSFSKAYALTGARVGSVIASPEMMQAIEKVLDCIAICAPHASQKAALFGLQNLEGWKEEKRQMMAHRLVSMRSALSAHASQYALIDSGAFFAYVKHPFKDVPGRQVAMALAHHTGVLTLPGSMFGPGQDGYLRLAFANVGADLMDDAARRIGSLNSAQLTDYKG